VSSIRSLASQTALYGLSSIVGRFLNYLLVPLYTRVFSPEAYGVVSEFYAYSTFLIVVFTYGMETALFHFTRKSNNPDSVYKTVLSTITFSSTALAILLIVFSQPVSNLLKYPEHPEYITWFAMILAFDAISSIPFAKLRLEEKAKKFALYKLLNIVFNIGLNLFFLVFAKGLYEEGSRLGKTLYDPSIGVGYVFMSNLAASGLSLLLFAPSMKKISLQNDSMLIKTMLRYSMPLMIAGFAGMINETLDRAIYKYLVPDKTIALHQLGIYSACYKVAVVMTLFIQTFRYAAEPFFFSHAKKEIGRGLNAIVLNYFMATCCFIFVVVMLYLNLFMYFVGEEFRAGAAVVPILLIANLFLGIYLYLSLWYKLSGQTHYGAWFSIFGAVITIALLVSLVPRFGYIGAAWATLLCYAGMMILSFITGQKHYAIPYDLRTLIILLLSALAVYFVNDKIQDLVSSSTLRESIKITLLIVYAAFSWKMIKRSNMKLSHSEKS
jgi:O-antigen/teichoic acid export membrane protein